METGRFDKYSSSDDSYSIHLFKIGNKTVTKEEWLKHNGISRKTSVHGWTHKVYDGKFDKLIWKYVRYEIV